MITGLIAFPLEPSEAEMQQREQQLQALERRIQTNFSEPDRSAFLAEVNQLMERTNTLHQRIRERKRLQLN